MSEPLRPLSRPRRLVEGDTVAVVATSGPVPADRLQRGVSVLESWGLTVRLGDHVFDADPVYPFLAGTDADRAADLQRAWCDPDVAAVFVARGGSGAARLIDRLDWAAMKAAGPKLLVGFSDVTALSEAVAAELGLVSLFGPMPATVALGELPPDARSAEHLRRTLFEPADRTGCALRRGATCVVPGRRTGCVVGGTCSLLTMSVGTAQRRPANGGIAVLEDIGEVAYRLDNRLTHLLRTGWFDGVRGIVLGSWEDCGPDAQDSVSARLRELDVPMVAGLPIGHCIPLLTVPLGVDAELDADAGTLTLLTPALL